MRSDSCAPRNGTFDLEGANSIRDRRELSSFDHTPIPGVLPAPDSYDGPFSQLDVVAVQRAGALP
jgi:hypothetical protein